MEIETLRKIDNLKPPAAVALNDYFGKLLPYEHSFENVLIAAISLCREQRKELAEVSERLYQLSKSDKQTA